MKKFLSLFSYIFHPLFIPIIATLFYFYFGVNYHLFDQIYFVIIQTVIITVIIPILFYWLLFTLKKVDSIMVAEINQRKIPLIVQSGLLLYLIQFIIKKEYFYELYFCFLASILSTILAFLFLFLKQKASLHMLGVTSLLSFVVLMSLHTQNNFVLPIALMVFVCGAVASSRLVMKAHIPKELVLGSILGILPQILFAYFWV
jgi:hypothetical protein